MVADFNKKANREFFNNKLLFKIVGIIFLLIVIVFTFADFKIYQKKRELTVQVANYQKQIEGIKKSSQTLKDEIANSDSKDYLEKLAYEQLGQQRPGEKEIIFISPPQEESKTNSTSQNFWDVKLWSGWFLGAWNWLKSKF